MTETLARERTPVGRSGESHSLVELVKELRDETLLLFRQEVLLARREVQEKFAHVRRNTIAMIVGATLAGLGVVFLLLAASFGLTEALIEMGVANDVAVWLGPLIVGLIMSLGGGTLAWLALQKLRETSVTPEKTIASLEESGRWAKEKVKEL
jgi:hypothetical protein